MKTNMDKLTGDKEVDTNIVVGEFLTELAAAEIASLVYRTKARVVRTAVGLVGVAVAVPALGAVVAGTAAVSMIPLAYNYATARRVAA
jgi:hypothetical protein